MTTSKGTIQGYNGVATVDKKHQIIVDAQAFGHGQEHHTLRPVLDTLQERYRRLGIRKNLYKGRYKPIITADTGFANEANMQYLHAQRIDAYIPDNQFRSRDPKFQDQSDLYLPCRQPAQPPRRQRERDGPTHCLFRRSLAAMPTLPSQDQVHAYNPSAADHRKGAGRQVSFALDSKRKPTYTDWMRHRVDSDYGKQIYSHRMSTVEPVLGNIGTNKGLNRFSLRGRTKVQGQWQLYCMVHNIEKLKNYGSSDSE